MVAAGLVSSLARPGGNVTGISLLSPELDGKRQDILIAAVPNARRIAAMADSAAQQPKLPTIGFLHPRSHADTVTTIAAFGRGLRETGFIEGENLAIEYRFADGQPARLTALAADLVQRQVAVIVAGARGGEVAKVATTTIPIVFLSAGDPVRTGLERDFETAFATMVQERAGALLVTGSVNFLLLRDRLVALAARYKLPAFYELREYAEVGGLMSYGPSNNDAWRQIGVYTGRILKGDKPANLPVVQPTKFELVINVKTARALGLTIPPGVLAIADEVIE